MTIGILWKSVGKNRKIDLYISISFPFIEVVRELFIFFKAGVVWNW